MSFVNVLFVLSLLLTGLACCPDLTATETTIDPLLPRTALLYQGRRDTIEALLGAMQRIADEKGVAEHYVTLRSSVSDQLNMAKSHFERKDYDRARQILDDIYPEVRNAIAELRDGDTLVQHRDPESNYSVPQHIPTDQEDYEYRSRWTTQLLQTYLALAVEQNHVQQSSAIEKEVDRLLKEGISHASSGEFATAVIVTKRAYILVQASLAALRDRQLMSQSLQFESLETEYQYYLHQTLSQMDAINLALDSSVESSKSEMVARLLESSALMIEEASVSASADRYDIAIPLIEQVMTHLHSGLMLVILSP